MNPVQLELYARLEQIVGPRAEYDTVESYYDCIEQTAIAILDSEYMNYAENELQAYLMEYLEHTRRELELTGY